jgi:hypothetical protein
LFRFLASQNVTHETEITQDHLDDFINSRPRTLAQLARPVRFLNRYAKLFRRLTLPKAPPVAFTREHWIGDKPADVLIAQFLNPSPADRRNSLIALFIILYGQRVKDIVKWRVDDVKRSLDGGIQLRLGKTDIELNAAIARMLNEHIATRETRSCMDMAAQSQWVFPGHLPAAHLRPPIVHDWLKKRHGVFERQLWSCAIDRMFRLGDLHPQAVRAVTGAKKSTTARYWQRTNPRVREELLYRHGKAWDVSDGVDQSG